jgi:hypothetical protein
MKEIRQIQVLTEDGIEIIKLPKTRVYMNIDQNGVHSWFIPGNVPSLKNSKVWTGKYLVASPSVKRWQKISLEAWQAQKDSFREVTKDLPRPYFIHFTFLRKVDNYWDITAPTETIADEMVRHGWINDDNIYEFIPVFGKPRLERKEPGTIIKVLIEPPKFNYL